MSAREHHECYPGCWHHKCANSKWNRHDLYRHNINGIALRVGALIHTLQVFNESCDVRAKAYFDMCWNALHVGPKVGESSGISIKCITTSLSFLKEYRQKLGGHRTKRLEHLHSWMCFGDEVNDSKGKVNLTYCNVFGANTNSGGCNEVSRAGSATYMAQTPYAEDRTDVITNINTLNEMHSNPEGYKKIFERLYSKVTNGKQYIHGESLCFTFMQYVDNCPSQFTMAVDKNNFIPLPTVNDLPVSDNSGGWDDLGKGASNLQEEASNLQKETVVKNQNNHVVEDWEDYLP